MAERSGQVLKGYELIGQIGEGGFGVVYRAYQPLLKRPVAIKSILPAFANRPDFIRRFEVEAELIARLEHPHIVPLYDYWREPDGAYLVMRWVPGGSLRESLEQGAWDTTTTARLVDEITAALMVAHRHGVIHRDIKPDNILLDEDGNAYLADFGIANDIGQAELTETEAGTGTPAYFAPEQIRGAKPTPKADQYSFGIMLFEVLTGTQPFSHEAVTITDVIFKHLNDPLPPLREYNPDLPTALDSVLQRATAKNPDDRYEDAHQLAVAFRQALVETSTQSSYAKTEKMTDLLSDLVIDLRTTDVNTPPPANPYKGLHSFQEADSSDFFGRDRLIQQLIQRMSENSEGSRFLAVVGPSGSGKSSVVKAGLIPKLRQGAMPNSADWFIAQMVPGDQPLVELENALLRVAANPPENLLDHLREDERGLLRSVKRILPEDQSELMLVIDQFEEVFTQFEDTAARTHFLDSLYVAVTDPASQIRVIVTLRADFYDRPLQYRQFGELMRTRMESVLPLSSEELRQSIVAPAQRVGVALEPELVTAIISDVGEQPGTLPLVQYALTELFERQQGRLLTLATYREIGGITGALARRAEELYTTLDDEGQEAARQLFLRLVTLGEGNEDTRRRVRRTELVSTANNSESLDAVIDAYGHYRLLTFDRDPATRGPTVEIAHEALLRVWTRLRDWIDDSREELRIHRRLTAAAHEWEEAGNDLSFLASGSRLTQFEEWAAGTRLILNEEETSFLERSLAEREAQRKLEEERTARETELARLSARRLRWLVAGLAVFLVVALALSAFALDRQQQAQTQAGIAADNEATAVFAQEQAEQQAALAETQAALAELNADQAQALALAARSQLVLEGGNSDLALLLALEANKMVEDPPIEILHALTSAAYAPGTRALLVGHTQPITGVAISPDGQTALSSGGDELTPSGVGEMIQWNLTTGEAIRQFEGHENIITSLDIDPSGRTAISGDYDGVVILWDMATGEILDTFQDPSRIVRQVAFSPDGQTFLTSGGVSDETVKIWDMATGRIIQRLTGHTDQIDSAAFSPDGATIASGARNGELILWDIETGEEIRRFDGHADAVNDLAFSPDGQQLVSGGSDVGLIIWNVETGEEIRRIPLGVTYAVAFSPDGSAVLSGLGTGSSGVLTLWDVETGAEIHRYIGHSAPVNRATFNPDGRMILSGSADGSLRLWYTDSGAELQRIPQSDGVEGVAFSPDGRLALSGARDSSVTLTDVTTGEEIHRFEGHTDIVRSVAFSPDGELGYSASLDGAVIVWDLAAGNKLFSFNEHEYSVLSVDISPDGERALSVGFDTSGAELAGELLLWDAKSGEVIRRLEQPSINAVFSPDGRTALVSVVGFGVNDVKLWDIETGEWLDAFSLGSAGVWGLAFSPDGQFALLGLADSIVSLWDIQAGEEVRRFVGHADLVNGVAYSPDGKMALSASNDYTMILWDTGNGAELYHFDGFRDYVRSVAYSDDGTTALFGLKRCHTETLADVFFA